MRFPWDSVARLLGHDPTPRPTCPGFFSKKILNGKTLIPGKDHQSFECKKLNTNSENGDHLLINVAETCLQC